MIKMGQQVNCFGEQVESEEEEMTDDSASFFQGDTIKSKIRAIHHRETGFVNR